MGNHSPFNEAPADQSYGAARSNPHLMNYTLTLKPIELKLACDDAATLPMRERVHALEAKLLAMPQLEIVPKHYFADGCYAREITIPAGSTVTGRIHKHSQINILSKGEISVLTEDGIVRVSAPFTVVSPPGTKRVAFTHTECVWTTILGTDETDPDVIKDTLTTNSEAEYLAYVAQLQIEDTSCHS